MRVTYHPKAEGELIGAAQFYERRVPTLGAQFAIYYRVFPDHLRVLAFKHHSRHPDYWRQRISD